MKNVNYDFLEHDPLFGCFRWFLSVAIKMTQDEKSQKRQSITKEHKVKKEPEIVLSDSSSDSEEEEDSNDRRQDQVTTFSLDEINED